MTNSSDTKQAAPQTLRLICCASNAEEYCLEMAAVSSIGRLHQLGFQSTWEGVKTPAGAIGWITAQQNRLPVFDLATQLHSLTPAASQNLHEGFVMLINAAEPFGLRVDRIVSNLEIEPTQIVALPHIIEPTREKRFKGIVKLEDKWLLCADAGKLQHTPLAPTITLSCSEPTAPLTASTLAPTQPKTTPQIMLFSSAQRLDAPNESPSLVFGLSLMQVQEISPLLPILPVPNAPNYVFGVANWREVPIPIIDLQTRLGLSPQPASAQQIDSKSRLLIARAQTGWVGIPIHPQVKAFPLPIPYQRHQQRLALEQDLVLGIFDLEGSPLVIPNLEAMLTRNFTPQHFS